MTDKQPERPPSPPSVVRRGDERDWEGRIRCMAEADGYVMVRRKGCYPFIMEKKEWLSLHPWPPGESPNEPGQSRLDNPKL